MARLVYQNTAAPDFSSSLAGIGQATRMLAGAADATKNLFAGLQQRDAELADRLVAERALRFQDPTQLQSALVDGSLIGDQTGRVSVAGLNALGQRVGALTTQGTNLDALSRTRADNALRDAGRADAAEYLRSAQTGNAANAKQAFNAAGISGLPLADQLELAKAGQQALMSDSALQRADFSLASDMRADRRADQLAQAQDYVFRNSYDGQSALSAAARATQGGDARVAQALREQLGPMYPLQFQPGAQSPMMGGAGGRGVGHTPSAPGKAGTREGSVYDTTFEYRPSATPITQMNMGDVQSMQTSMQRTQGHSPLGAFQINKATLEDFAPRVLGKNWQSMPFSPENQDKIGEAIFNARKDGNLKSTWAALPDSRPGAYKDRTWDEVKNEIATRETGQSLQSRVNPILTGNAIEDLGRADTIANAGNSNSWLMDLQGDRSTRADVAKMLSEDTFKGYGQGRVSEELRKIEAQGFNPAQAGQILRDSASSRAGAVQAAQFLPIVGKNIPSTTWDSDLIQEGVNRAKQMLSDSSASRDRGQVAAGIAQAEQAVQNARQKAVQVRMRANALGSPSLRAEADRADAALAKAVAQYELINSVQQGTQRYTTSNLTPGEKNEVDKAKGDPAKLSPELRDKIASALNSPDMRTPEGRLLNLGNIRN